MVLPTIPRMLQLWEGVWMTVHTCGREGELCFCIVWYLTRCMVPGSLGHKQILLQVRLFFTGFPGYVSFRACDKSEPHKLWSLPPLFCSAIAHLSSYHHYTATTNMDIGRVCITPTCSCCQVQRHTTKWYTGNTLTLGSEISIFEVLCRHIFLTGSITAVC